MNRLGAHSISMGSYWRIAPQGVEVAIVEFSTMSHGFLSRGDWEDPEVATEVGSLHVVDIKDADYLWLWQVARAMTLTVDFLAKQFGEGGHATL